MIIIRAFFGPSLPGEIAGYLLDYDPDASDGGMITGNATFTDDPDRAMTFADTETAARFAMQVSAARPLRADGRPNRPLMAFTLEFMELDA